MINFNEVLRIFRKHLSLDIHWVLADTATVDTYRLYISSGLLTMKHAESQGVETAVNELREYILRRGGASFIDALDCVEDSEELDSILPELLLSAAAQQDQQLAYAGLALALGLWALHEGRAAVQALPWALSEVGEAVGAVVAAQN